MTDYTNSITCQGKLWNGWPLCNVLVHLIRRTPAWFRQCQPISPGNILFSFAYTPLFSPTITDAPSEQNPTRHYLRKASSRPCFCRQLISVLLIPSRVVLFSSISSKKKVSGSELLIDVLRYTIRQDFLLNEVLSSTIKVSYAQVALMLANNACLISLTINAQCLYMWHLNEEPGQHSHHLSSEGLVILDNQSKDGYFSQYSMLF